MKLFKYIVFASTIFLFANESYSLVGEREFLSNPGKNYEALIKKNAQVISNPEHNIGIAEIDKLIDSKKELKKVIPDPVYNVNFNNFAFEFSQTPSGAYLTYQHPDLYPEDAIRVEIKSVLNRIKKILERLQRTKENDVSQELLRRMEEDNDLLVEEVYNFLTPLLYNEIHFRKQNKTILYHGHDNKLRLYFDMLKEFQRYDFLRDLGQAKPLRDIPVSDPITNVPVFLKEFDKQLKDYAKQNEIYDENNESGYVKNWYPDNMDWARLHAISLVPSLFTNTHWAANLSESALFYFLNSTNISNPLEVVILNLLKRFSPKDITEEELKKRAEPFYEIFNKYMSKAGGNMLQLVVDNDALDTNFYLSWRGGTPIWIDAQSNRLATRKKKYRWPITLIYPAMDLDLSKYIMPKISEALELYAQDPKDFMEKFSTPGAKSHEKLDSYAHMQVRGIIHPKIFSDENKVAVFSSTRFSIDSKDEAEYYAKLNTYVHDIMKQYIDEDVYKQDDSYLSPIKDFLTYAKNMQFALIQFKVLKDEGVFSNVLENLCKK